MIILHAIFEVIILETWQIAQFPRQTRRYGGYQRMLCVFMKDCVTDGRCDMNWTVSNTGIYFQMNCDYSGFVMPMVKCLRQFYVACVREGQVEYLNLISEFYKYQFRSLLTKVMRREQEYHGGDAWCINTCSCIFQHGGRPKRWVNKALVARQRTFNEIRYIPCAYGGKMHPVV